MLRDAGKQDKAEIYELWKQSYPNQNRNYLNFYFKNIFDKGRCIALEQDQRIISSLQLNEHILRLRDKQLKISYILGVSTLPDYRRRGHMRRLMESALDEAGHNHLVTLIRGFIQSCMSSSDLRPCMRESCIRFPENVCTRFR